MPMRLMIALDLLLIPVARHLRNPLIIGFNGGIVHPFFCAKIDVPCPLVRKPTPPFGASPYEPEES